MFNNQTMRAISMASLVGVLSLSATNLSGVTAAPTKPSADSKSYVTAIFKNSNKNDESQNHIAGVELDLYDNVNQFNRMESANAYWVRSNAWAINWRQLESNGPGEYNPSDPNYGGQHMREYEYLMRTAYDRGFKVIQIIRGAPSWASPAGKDGCAIRPEHYDNFANFVGKIVQKYSKPPYNIQYWEIWNEPDGLFDASGLFGCWGDPNDQYFGGRAYGEMLIKAGGAVLRADPKDDSRNYAGSRVVFGGLLLDCIKPCASADFLDGALIAKGVVDGKTTSASQWFQVINFHAYDIWRDNNVVGHYDNPNFGSAWNTSGPTVAAKTDFVRSVLSTNGAGTKAIMNTEAAVLCYCGNQTSEIWNETKAIYLAQSNITAKAKGLLANVWYSYTGWQDPRGFQTELTPGRGEKAYQAFKTNAIQLKDAKFVRENTSYPGLRVYEFNRRGNLLLVAWKIGDGEQSMTLPATPAAVTDTFGNVVAPSQTINVTLRPVYIELAIPVN